MALIKRRLEVYAHGEIASDTEPISANVSNTETVVMPAIEISGIRGSIQVRNGSSSTSITVKTWVSNYKNCETPLTAGSKWYKIDERSVAASSGDMIRISGTYKWICITAVSTTSAGPLELVPYFAVGGI